MSFNMQWMRLYEVFYSDSIVTAFPLSNMSTYSISRTNVYKSMATNDNSRVLNYKLLYSRHQTSYSRVTYEGFFDYYFKYVSANTFKYHVFAPMGRFQLELIYLYFPPSSHLIDVCFCPVGLSLL